jgi:hypothetical protein
MMAPVLGDRMQNASWRNTLPNLARQFGVEGPPVESRIVIVDADRQWSNWTNLWNNAAIRTALTAPPRMLRGKRP